MGPGPIDGRYEKWPVQDLAELQTFVQFVKDNDIRSYLEIGAKYGGSFWHIVGAMPKGSVAVAIDLPFGSTFKRPFSQPYLMKCAKELRHEGYDVHVIIGDSTHVHVINEAKRRGPYDLVLIDANHEESYVRQDWKNYGVLGKIVAFHDISYDMNKNFPGKIHPIQVPKVWDEIKKNYRHQEIRMCKTPDNGFGILWH